MPEPGQSARELRLLYRAQTAIDEADRRSLVAIQSMVNVRRRQLGG